MESATKCLRTCDAKCRLVSSRERSDNLYVLLDGLLTRECVVDDGRRQILGLHVPGDVCGLAALSNGHAACDMVALSRVAYVSVPRTLLSLWARESADVSQAMWRELSREVAISNASIVNLGKRPAYQRTAYFMCELEARLRVAGHDTADGLEWPGNQSDIGAATGLSLVHMNKTLRKLEADKLVVTRPRVKFHDMAKLSAVAGFDPSYLALEGETLGDILLARTAALAEARGEKVFASRAVAHELRSG